MPYRRKVFTPLVSNCDTLETSVLNRKQVACEDARKTVEDTWAVLQTLEKTLNGHEVKSKMLELAFSAVHLSLSLLAEQVKCEYEKEKADVEFR